MAGGLLLALLAASSWLPRATSPAAAPAAPDVAAALALRPAKLLRAGIREPEAARLGKVLERLLPVLPGLTLGKTDELRVEWYAGDPARPLYRARGKVDLTRFDPASPGHLRGDEGIFPWQGTPTGPVLYLAPHSRHLLASAAREYVEAARRKQNDANVVGDCRFRVAFDRLRLEPALEPELDRRLRRVFDLAEALEGKVDVVDGHVAANLHFTARSEERARKLGKELKDLKIDIGCFVDTRDSFRDAWGPLASVAAVLSDPWQNGREVILQVEPPRKRLSDTDRPAGRVSGPGG
jgi:hypothetical protein